MRPLESTTSDAAGAAPPAAPLRPPSPGGISLRPAMVVLGLAVLIIAVFVTLGLVTSHSSAPPRRPGTTNTVAGSALRARAANDLLAPIVSAGEPPANVQDAVEVPVGSVRVSHQDQTNGSGTFDAQVVVRVPATQAALADFFSSVMKLQGWQIIDRGPATHHPGAIEVLGKLAGSDGYFWEMGAIVAPTTFSAGGPAHGQTDVTIRLLQEGDDAS